MRYLFSTVCCAWHIEWYHYIINCKCVVEGEGAAVIVIVVEVVMMVVVILLVLVLS